MADSNAGEPAPATSRVSSQALDVLLKLEAEQIATLLSSRFGLDLAPIRRPLPTELPLSRWRTIIKDRISWTV